MSPHPLYSLRKKLSRSVTSLFAHSSSSETSLLEPVPRPKTDTLTVTVYQNRDAWDPDKEYIAAAISIDFFHRTAADIVTENNDEVDQDPDSHQVVQSTFRSEMAKTQETCFQGKLHKWLEYRIRDLDHSLVSSYTDTMSELVNEAPGSVCVKSLEKLGVDLQVIKDQSMLDESGLAEMMKRSTWLLVNSRGKIFAPKGPSKPASDSETSRLSNDCSWLTMGDSG